MKATSELREKMWELCYDLLPEGERTALIAQIKSDPQTARLYAEVRLQADLVGFAAKVEDSSLILSSDEEKPPAEELAPAAHRRKEAAIPPAASSTPGASWRVANVVAYAAGLALVLVMAVGVYYPMDASRQMAHLVATQVEVPSQLTPGVSTKMLLRTFGPDERPVAAQVDVEIRNQAGEVLHREVVATTAEGRTAIDVPGSAIPLGAQLRLLTREKELAERESASPEAQAGSSPAANFLEAELPVVRHEPLQYFLAGTPAAKPGEVVQFAYWGLHPYSFAPASPRVGNLVVNSMDGQPRTQPMWRADDYLAEGTFAVPMNSSDSALAVADQDKSREPLTAVLQIEQTKEEADLNSRKAADARELLAPTPESAAATAVPLRFRGGGDKAAVAMGFGAGQPGQGTLAEAKQDYSKQKRQVFAAGEPVEVDAPVDALGKKLVADVEIRGHKLVRQMVEARVVRSPKEAGQNEALPKVALNLPSELDGSMQVTLFDASQTPAKVISKEFFYRMPARELQVQQLNRKDRYDPGELVTLKLQIRDENGQPAAAKMAARVWSEEYIPAEREQLVMLADRVRQVESFADRSEEHERLARFGRPGRELSAGTDQLAQAELRKKAEDLKKMAHAAAEGAPAPPAPAIAPDAAGAAPAAGVPAAPAATAPTGAAPAGGAGLAESLAGGLGGERGDEDRSYLFADGGASAATDVTALAMAGELSASASTEGMVLLVRSNQAEVIREFRSLKSQRDRDLQAWQAHVGRVLIGGGLVALAALGLAFVMRMQVRWTSGTMALVAAAASLIVGAVWISDERQEVNVAMLPHNRASDAAATTPAPIEVELAKSPRLESPRLEDEKDAVKESLSYSAPQADGFIAPGAAPAVNAPLPTQEATRNLGSLTTQLAPAPTTTTPSPAPSPAKPGEQGDPAGFAQPDDAPAAPAAKGVAGAVEKATPSKPAAVGGQTSGKNKNNVELAKDLEGRAAQSAGGAGRGAGGGEGLGSFGGGERGGRAAGASPASSGAPGAAGPLGGGMQRGSMSRAARSGQSPPGQSQQGQSQPGQADRPGGLPADALGVDALPAGALPTDALPADNAQHVRRAHLAGIRGRGLVTVAPASIYFNPRLATDENGLVTIEFQLPEVESEYRVLIDAFGNGRVGSSAELRIVCKREAAPPAAAVKPESP